MADIVKSIKERSVTDEEMGRFWRENEIGYSWNRESGLNSNFDSPYFESLFQNQIQYSVFYRRLVSDRFMTGVGVSNANSAQRLGGGFEFRYLPTPDLQLSLLVGGAFGAAKDSHTFQTNAQFGLHWTLR